MQTQFTVRSETYAEKTRRLLERYRYHFGMQKTTGRDGCTYRFTVAVQDTDELAALLQAAGIPYQPLGY
ncbi:MAG: hypothetical protein IK107_02705 [Oscillospiraceae bacterium]|nr:hypothetical protein [Oscillospiraceae bacterium]